MKGMNAMYSYKGKIAGIIIAGLGLAAMIAEKLTGVIVLQKFNSGQHFNFMLWVTLLGLFTIMFSKEKREDERVQQIRARALMYAFLVTMGATLAFALTVTMMPSTDPQMANGVTFNRDEVIEAGRMMVFYPAIGIVLYLVIFHVGLYYDTAWDYEDKTWSPRMLWQNKRWRLLYLVTAIIIIMIIFKLIE